MPMDLNCRAGVATLISRDNKEGTRQFLIFFNKKREEWECAGGKVNPKETFTEAAIREVEEETNLRLNPDNIKIVRLYSNETEDGNTFVMPFFHYDISQELHQLKYLKLSSEHAEYCWRELSGLIAMLDSLAPRLSSMVRDSFHALDGNFSEVDITLADWYPEEKPDVGFSK